MSDAERRVLLSTELRSLTAEELAPYVYSAPRRDRTTGDDFLYFLPRIAELIFTQDWAVESEQVFTRIGGVPSASLSLTMRSGLIQFLHALLAEAGRMTSENDGASDWLVAEVVCSASKTGLPIAPILEALLPHPEALRRLHRANPLAETTGALTCCFLDDQTENSKNALLAWLWSDQVMAILTARR